MADFREICEETEMHIERKLAEIALEWIREHRKDLLRKMTIEACRRADFALGPHDPIEF